MGERSGFEDGVVRATHAGARTSGRTARSDKRSVGGAGATEGRTPPGGAAARRGRDVVRRRAVPRGEVRASAGCELRAHVPADKIAISIPESRFR